MKLRLSSLVPLLMWRMLLLLSDISHLSFWVRRQHPIYTDSWLPFPIGVSRAHGCVQAPSHCSCSCGCSYTPRNRILVENLDVPCCRLPSNSNTSFPVSRLHRGRQVLQLP
ncbi:hypothetical protein BT96DRAFT_513352 [Gymnopus androsaceus JB14]|uniref:Secreted protein n=1 Tax=Gymnopus androsaceus JB14 TaxID=1447944 RepID=A0A6A4GLX0_9AGAR|nr:hypothetical protein BT96DRAFT_513352 [Gymnopus androsaceus JB14]